MVLNFNFNTHFSGTIASRVDHTDQVLFNITGV